MPRFKHVDREQGLMIPVSLKEQILPGTFEYTIDYIVDEKIDTTRLEAKFKNDETGSTAYSPKVLLKIILFAYSRGIISSRKIQRLCEENIVFMALTGGLAPDFTTIAGFVREMKDDIERIFQDVLLICSELDLLGGTEFALDGCKISSNASKEWSGTFSDLKKKKEKLGKTILFLIEKHKKNDKKETGKNESDKRKIQIEKIESKVKKIDNFLKSNKSKSKSRRGEKQSNITDNESAKIKTSHGVIQGYNGIAISDSKHQIIVNAEAFGQGAEHDLLKPVIEGAKENVSKIGFDKKYFERKRLIADTGSFCEENLEYLSGEKIDAYIPDQQFRKRDPRFEDAERFKKVPGKTEKRYTKYDFTYNEDDDTFKCPGGNILKFSVYQKFNNTEGRKYISKKSFCDSCFVRNKCLKSEKTRYRTLYVIEKFFNRNYSGEMKKKIDTEEGREIYSRRMGIVEPVFGNIRNAKGLDHFTLRTKQKVNIQWMLFCMVHNIEKIMKYGNYEKLVDV
jgi:transposase